VVNTNASVLPVRIELMGFAPSDEQGHGTFIDPSKLTNDPDALANWIIVSSAPVSIPPGGAVDVPFSIVVPHDAAPGGHYAAILIGTEPGAGEATSHVGVSSFISSLIFVRVAGDINESGNIQEFSTDKALYQDPNVNFTLRFQNTGNVHVRPVGEIDIYNAFGKKRGEVDINQTGNLGYVLPSSTRRFDVSWQGDASLLDIGQYTAVLTFSYGEDGKKSVSQTVTFWVLPLEKLAEDFFWAVLIIGGFIFILKRFVRKMLTREISRYGVLPRPPAPPDEDNHRERVSGDTGTIDLRKK
jgi:hypothetical protein